MEPPELELKWTEMRLSYAWKYFSFHARQRTLMLNFFLIVVGIIANGVALVVRFDLNAAFLIALLVVGALVALAFYFLDRRNVQLLGMGEEVLRKLERDSVFRRFGWVDRHPDIPLGFLHRENVEEARLTELQRDECAQGGDEAARAEEIRYLKERTRRLYTHGFWIPRIQLLIMSVFLCGLVATFLRLILEACW